MTTVNSKMPTNLFVTAPPLSGNSIEGGVFDFSPGQMLRGMVVNRELDQIVLEINRQLYLAQGERELQIGQKVNLQVVQTQPQLELKVLLNPLDDRLSQSLPLLTRPFDWNQLVVRLQEQQRQGLESAASLKVSHQLQQILKSTSGVSVQLDEQITRIVAQLKQLSVGEKAVVDNDLLLPLQFSQSLKMQGGEQHTSPGVSPIFMRVIKDLQNQLSLLPKEIDIPLPKSWYVTTRNLLAPLQQTPQLPQLMISQRQLLVSVLNQIQQHPRVSPQLSGEVTRILVQIDKQITGDIPASSVRRAPEIVGPADAKRPFSLNSEVVDAVPRAKSGDGLPVLSTEIKQLLSQVQLRQENQQSIAPELLGRLEGLLSRLGRLPQTLSEALPGFEVMVSQLEQLVAQRPSIPQGRQLGLLSQLFGFHLEAELLQGKKRDALNSLKLSLLDLQKDIGGEVKEPLHRIELFQLCKARLAEEQVAFLPLPFEELEEGYLLAEKQTHENSKHAEEDEPHLQLSLSLRLSALGNLRIDMLYEKQGLHLRLACEDRGKMDYLKHCAEELKESLEAVVLQGVSFDSNAKLPARQLQERLLPESFNLLDERL